MKEVKEVADVEEVEEVNQVKGERSEAVYAAAVWGTGYVVRGTGYGVRGMWYVVCGFNEIEMQDVFNPLFHYFDIVPGQHEKL